MRRSIEQKAKYVITEKAQQYRKVLNIEGNVLPDPVAGNSKLYGIACDVETGEV